MKSVSVQSGSMQSSAREAAGYSSEDVQQILAIALRDSDTFSATYLQEMADDLSIGDVALREAIETWQAHKTRQLKTHQRRQAFYRQALLPYLVVNTFLMLLNLSLSGAITWAIYPLLGWGAGLGLVASSCLVPCQGMPIHQGVS